MRGTKTERAPGVWRLRVYVGTDVNGRPVQKSRTFHGGSRKADDALRKFVTEVEQARTPQRDATVARLLDTWLDHLITTKKARPVTVDGYRYVINGRLKPSPLGRRHLDKLTARHLDEQYRTWLEEGVTPANVYKYHQMLSAALHQAVKWDWVPQAVTEKATPPSHSPPAMRAMTIDHVQTLVRVAEEGQPGSGEGKGWAKGARGGDPELATAIALAAVTGCRRGELCGLKWSDFDPATATLTVRRSITVAKGGKVHTGDTKTNQVRRMALGLLAAEVIEQRKRYQQDLAAEMGATLVPDPWLLSRRADGDAPCLPPGLTLAFSRLREQLGLPYHFHELRHFAASMAIAAGVDIRTVAGRLGHAQPHITLKTYAHVVQSADQVAANILDRALESKVSGGA